MDNIIIEKKANCYTVELNGDYRYDAEDEEYFYKTKEEMVMALPELVERAHVKVDEDKATYENKRKAEVVKEPVTEVKSEPAPEPGEQPAA